jgi:hypothetical protein
MLNVFAVSGADDLEQQSLPNQSVAFPRGQLLFDVHPTRAVARLSELSGFDECRKRAAARTRDMRRCGIASRPGDDRRCRE